MINLKKQSSLNKDLLSSYNEFIQSENLFLDKFKDKNIQQEAKAELKELILDYLNFKLENGEKWIKGLIYIVKKQQFLSKQFLTSIFYLDIYDIIIKPKCFNIKFKKKLYPQSKIFSYDIIQNNDSIFDEETKLYKIKLQENYELFEVIKRQLEYKENPFNIIINNFIIYFTEEVKNKNKYLENIEKSKDYENCCTRIFNAIKEQINEFVIFISKCIVVFYQLNNLQEFDTYYALLISFIFNGRGNSKKLYQSLMELISKKEKNKLESFKKNYLFYKKNNLLKPEIFLVEKKFCLNECSKEIDDVLSIKDYEVNLLKSPYESSINNLKKIETYQNPFDKLLLTVELSKIISKEISDFWSQVDENDLKKSKINLNIEADDFISIFKYILIKGEFLNIHSEICFIESFTTNQIKSEKDWYYLSLIQVSLMQLEEIKIE